MITTITKVESPKISKDNHSGGWYHNGTKTEYFVTYDKEKVPVPGIKASNEMTSQETRNWFHGNIEMTVLMAVELGSNSLVGDLQAYLQVNKQYEAALNVLPPLARNTQYDNPYNANIARLQGNTISSAILKHRKNTLESISSHILTTTKG